MEDLKPQAWAAIKAQTKSAMTIYGKPLGFEKISEKDLSPSLKSVVYVQKFEGYPVIWRAYFYRAKSDWLVTYVQFNDNVGSMLAGSQ